MMIPKAQEETTKGFSDDTLQHKSDQANLVSVKETVEGLDDDIPDFVEYFTLHFYSIDFFNDVAQVVHVRLIVNHKGKHSGYGFVEFASANEAKKALEKKSGEYLHGHRIFLHLANYKKPAYFLPKYCIDHKVWYDDYLGRESFLIEDDETEEGLDDREGLLIEKNQAEEGLYDTPDSFEKVLFVANLSPQTKISDIKGLFKYFGVVSVRLIVNNKGKHLGYAFVEFASAYRANKALKKKNGEYLHDRQIYLMKEHDETPDYVEAVAIAKKTLFVSHLSPQTEISDIINFFKDVGEVVHVQLTLNNKGRHVGYGFVEFASADEEEKVRVVYSNDENRQVVILKRWNHDRKIVRRVVDAPYRPPKYCVDHKVWYDDYLRREGLLMEENEAVKGLYETPDFVEPFAVTKKTLFASNLSHLTKISDIISFFKDVGEVVRVRLIVDHMGKPVGCGFIEFASAEEAEKALEKKNGERLRFSKICLDMAEIAPYPLRLKYNLAEKLWYEDKLRGGSLDLETKPKVVPKFCGKRIIFSND
ncbi:polyadenylate-binding protein, cytoplasmic and nuclear [Arabidopsis lyrata subsp. lyrata]|uniref:polyadenylate-binding protein, cytoplasmic and nuclear n=1 Tax=Arabidopsis lyrata subsp. lyrata TaxID=81972 RepID=UPI000A29B617|nr:polyadenylate-binding protein, cytoplasmic and nuclear [Arabidopsis lyrata subsp. lyrata]|eukprot:XP_020874171.1 polyadenylate-binding protein, cytoplasmic and nuclear [Arabidopsis lyrata subsp. lyrata]